MNQPQAVIFDILKFAIQDGPGIRTTVFLKGCPLHCLWCHNPESQKRTPEILFSPEKCIGCGWCMSACPEHCHSGGAVHVFDRTRCTGCGRCTERCYAAALELAGKTMTVDAVLEEVLKDRVFYENSGGGVTLSGGEPMAQIDFTDAFLTAARTAGLHTCMETCGFAPSEAYDRILKKTDLFLFDVKATDPEKHLAFTGVFNDLILNNLYKIDKGGGPIVLRCPLIPGLNDDDAHLTGIGRLASSLSHILRIEVEPYHPLGVGKSRRLGKEPDYPSDAFTDPKAVERWIKTIQRTTTLPVRKA